MTENLAGRGEGLADRLTESIWAISDGQHPDKDTLRNLIRNILAAAPAGTAPDTLENDTVHRCADKLNEMRDYGVLGGIAQKLGLPVSDSVAVAIIEKYAGPMGKIMRAGSPRKVGEDGALKADDYRLVPVCLIQRFGADGPGNEADTRWTVCLPNGDYAHIFPEYLLAQPTPQASSEIREALAELTELKRRMDSESGPKLWSYGTIYAYVVNRIEELLAAAAGVEERR